MNILQIQQSMLDSLKQRDAFEAKRYVESLGLIGYIVSANQPITLDAKPNTVVLWTEKGLVSLATAGDPLQIVP